MIGIIYLKNGFWRISMRIYLSDTMSCITENAVEHALNRSRRTIFVVPEAAKAQVERSVIRNMTGMGDGLSDVSIARNGGSLPVVAGFAGGDVVSFLKLSTRILEASGVRTVSSGNDIVMRNAVYSVLASHHDEFTTFASLTGRSENINKLISLIGDFVRYNITVSELDRAISSGNPDQTYINKLRDIRLLMTYLTELNERYQLGIMTDPISDAAEVLSGLDDARLKLRRYRRLRTMLAHEYAVVLFGVSRNFTPGESRLITALNDLATDISIYLNGSTDASGMKCNEYSGMVTDHFRGMDNVTIEPFTCEDYRSPDLSEIVRCYSASDSDSCTVRNTRDVLLREIAGTDNRIGYVLDEILRLTQKEGFRYRDIRIVCCDDELTGKMRSVASGYGLDVFIDRKITLNDTVVPRFVMELLRLPMTGFSLGDVMSVLRSGILRIYPRYADDFENYCVARNITDSSRMFDEDNFRTDPEDHHPIRIYVEENTVPGVAEGICNAGEFLWEHIVSAVLVPLRRVSAEIAERSDMAGKAGLILDYLDSIREYISALSRELMESGRSETAKATVLAYDETMSLLASFMHEMNHVEISQRNFLELFRTDMMNRASSTIPLMVDSIEITTPEHAFYTKCRVMFVIGAQRDNFPYKKAAEGIMSSNELSLLSGDITVELPDKRKSQNISEFIISCLMMGSVSDKLYMIHEQGKAKSRVFDILSGYVSGDQILINNYQTPVYGDKTDPNFRFDTAKISPELMDILLSDGLNVSVTSIERYMSCPIEFMLESVLNIRQRQDNREIRANSFGTLAHKMFELAISGVCADHDTPEKLMEYYGKLSDPVFLDARCEEILGRTIREEKVYGALESDGSVNIRFNNNQGNKLRRLFRFMYPEIIRECAESRYIPSEYELKIGQEPFLLRYSESGHEFLFKGSVDRMDISADEPGKFRIEDYKTFDKGFKADMLLAGVQIQLPAYANAIMNGRENYHPGRLGYTLITMKPGKGKLKFSPKDTNLSNEDMDTAVRYADHIIRKAIRDIASGRATGLLNPADKGSAKFKELMGLTGNPQSSPMLQEPIEYEKKMEFDKMREILDAENGGSSDE